MSVLCAVSYRGTYQPEQAVNWKVGLVNNCHVIVQLS